MKPLAIAGVLLIVFGLFALAYQGITYKERETILDIGPVQATTERQKTIPLPPVVGVLSVAAGVALVVVSRRRS
jgi:uncharacterized membrane protein HdeD (DUF308 family)